MHVYRVLFYSYQDEVWQGLFKPNSIGHSKADVLEILKEEGDWPIYPEPQRYFLGDPDGEIEKRAALLAAAAIEVRLSYNIFARMEFEADAIARFQFVYATVDSQLRNMLQFATNIYKWA